MRRLIATTAAAAALLAGPAIAQDAWVDITPEFTKILGREGPNSPYYLKKDSVKTIKSINFKNTTYKRGEFSYASRLSTERVDYLFDCNEAAYKLNDGRPGYWDSLSWITPGTREDSIQWMAYKYLCPSAKDPWALLAESVDDEEYWANTKAGYNFSSKKYGKVLTWVVAKVRAKSLVSFPDMYQVYVSCGTRRLSLYPLMAGVADNKVEIDEPNPRSIGDQVVRLVCDK